MSERNAVIERARDAGARYIDLAKEHGVSPARVRQIVLNRRRLRLEAECREGLHDELLLVEHLDWYPSAGSMTVGDVRRGSDADLKRVFGSNNFAPLRRRFGRA